MDKRVAVTGLGVLSCIGNDVQTFWKNLVDGVCGIDYITEFPTDNLAVKIGGMVRGFNPEEYGMISTQASTFAPCRVIRRAMISPMSPEPRITTRFPGMKPSRFTKR